ncbi:MAG: hypothetical protein J5855_06275 [Mailhella sp.]|nr:hypothetical protein [Mailhella sp.]
MLKAVTTPSEMSVWDARSRRFGIPEAVLMENAARTVFEELKARSALAGRIIWIFAGKGNNGGDGYCLARILGDEGAVPVLLSSLSESQYSAKSAKEIIGKMPEQENAVLRTIGACPEKTEGRPEKASNDRETEGIGAAALNECLAVRCGIPVICLGELDDDALSLRISQAVREFGAPDIVVDALLGTGTKGSLRSNEMRLVMAINRFKAFVCSVDIPSGLDGMTGGALPVAVQADMTVTFQAAKPGLLLPKARPYVGELIIRSIGIPGGIRSADPSSFCMVSGDFSQAAKTPAHKGEAGSVMIFGGSPSYKGALRLAIMGAFSGGAGLVYASGSGEVLQGLADTLPESVTVELSGDWGADRKVLAAKMIKLRSAVLGPGQGSRKDFVVSVLRLRSEVRPDLPFVLDADALNVLAEDKALLALVGKGDVLTPHPAEAARLLGISTPEVEQDRQAALRALQDLAPCVWVLKGIGTLAGRAGGTCCICPVDAPLLATAGSGDVLAGLIGALLARGVFMPSEAGVPLVSASEAAAFIGVRIHAQAGLDLERAFPEKRGARASDIASAIARMDAAQ